MPAGLMALVGSGSGSGESALAGRRTAGLAVAVGALLLGCRPDPSAPERLLRVSVPYDSGTLDPHARDTLSGLAILAHFYEPLVTTDRDLRLQPWLATSWESPDATTWDFHIRRGVRFHSGRPLRAADVVYTLKRLLEDPGLEVAGYLLYVTEVTALDELTVRLRTTRPPGMFLSKLRFVYVVPEGSTAEDLGRQPDGTGPYRLESWQSHERVTMARNEDYWNAAPAFERVELLLDRSPEQAAEDLLSGRSLLAELGGKAVAARVAADPRCRTLRQPGLFLHYLGFDLHRETTPFVELGSNPFLDRTVRQAFQLALARDDLVARLPSEALPATQVVPSPYIFGFNPKMPEPAHDVARARELLAQAGLPDGFRATLHVRKLFPEAAHLVREQLGEVGIELRVAVLDEEEFLGGAVKRSFSLFLSRLGTGTGDASDILEGGLHSPRPAARLGHYNTGGYSNPALDLAIERSGRIADPGRRRASIESIVELVAEELPWIPLYVDEHVYGIRDGLSWRPRADNTILASEVGPAAR